MQIGRDVRVQAEFEDGVELEGYVRLSPGQPVDVIWPETAAATPPPVQSAFVWTWRVVALGSGRPMYQGFCQWQAPFGSDATPTGSPRGAERLEIPALGGITVDTR